MLEQQRFRDLQQMEKTLHTAITAALEQSERGVAMIELISLRTYLQKYEVQFHQLIIHINELGLRFSDLSKFVSEISEGGKHEKP